MLSTGMQDAINNQIAREFYASHLYLSMRVYFEAGDYGGFAQWMKMQAEEERTHALKLLDYLLSRNGRPKIGAVAAPPHAFASVLDAFEQALAHEQHVSKDFDTLYELARAEKDFATQVMLQWFITEQVEEVGTASRIVGRLAKVVDNTAGILLLDGELGRRSTMDA